MKCSLVFCVAGLKDATRGIIVVIIVLCFGDDGSKAKNKEGGKDLGP